jgi:hypothetical protein
MDRQARSTQIFEKTFAAFPTFNSYAARMMLWPVQAWLHLQSDMLDAAAPAAAAWITRRRQGTAAALQALDKLSKCKDMKDASQVQSEWLADETKRIEADMRAVGDQTLALARAAEKVSREGAHAATAAAA